MPAHPPPRMFPPGPSAPPEGVTRPVRRSDGPERRASTVTPAPVGIGRRRYRPRLVGTIADDLVTLATTVVTDLGDPTSGVAPGLVLPATLAGHRVDADAHADLVFTLGLLREAGVAHIGAVDVEQHLHDRLAATDAARTHTFFSYRIAETVARLGGLDALAPRTRDVVVAAADSTEWIPLLDQGILPRNYAVVLTRCELARAALGLDVDDAVVHGLVERVAALLGESPDGWLDDSQDGRGQVDMYTVDAYLFAEPFSDRLGAVWERGVASAARLVGAVVSPGGAALPWGRSIGALAVCHSGELAALLLRRAHEGGAPVDAERWWGVARALADGAAHWFDRGLVVAHKRRAPFRYRGPFRRLQMTLDCVGKLVVTALDLRRAGPEPGTDRAQASDGSGTPTGDDRNDGAAPVLGPPAAGLPRAFDSRDEWIGFGDRIGVWAHRDPRLPFALPVVGGPGADYAPTPRHPGGFEVPTDQPLACFVPLAWRGDARFAPRRRGRRGAARARRPRPGARHLPRHRRAVGRGRPDPSGRAPGALRGRRPHAERARAARLPRQASGGRRRAGARDAGAAAARHGRRAGGRAGHDRRRRRPRRMAGGQRRDRRRPPDRAGAGPGHGVPMDGHPEAAGRLDGAPPLVPPVPLRLARRPGRRPARALPPARRRRPAGGRVRHRRRAAHALARVADRHVGGPGAPGGRDPA